MRIDLIPGMGDPSRAPVSPLTQMNWRGATKPPPQFVARSRYQELLQGLYDAVLMADEAGRIVDSNLRALDFLHYDRTELTKMVIPNVISGADEQLMATITETLEQQRHALIQAFCVRKDGTQFPAEIAVCRIHLDQPRVVFFMRDISLRYQTEQILRYEHYALHSAGIGIAIADMDMDLTFVNPALAVLLGMEAGDTLVGKPLSALFADAEEIQTLVEEAGKGATTPPCTRPTRLLKPDGTEAKACVTAAICVDEDGDPMGAVFTFLGIGKDAAPAPAGQA
jgi:PAS domain S-box-containing protein